MKLKTLKLQNFRSYQQGEFEFSGGTTVVVGPNASGKTNLLEATRFLAIGRSLRAGVEMEVIRSGQEIARVIGEIRDGEAEHLEIVITSGEVAGGKTAKKRFLVNGVARRLMDFSGHFRAVYFGPEDLKMIFDSPSGRRAFLDAILEMTDQEYRRASLSYQKGLRQRNRLLEQIRDEGRPRSVLFFWDKLLVENGTLIGQKRLALIDYINQQPVRFDRIKLNYSESSITTLRLEQYAEAEVAAGMTLIGPQRDDFQITQAERDLNVYGSRGEQRMAVVTLKLAELEFVTDKTGSRPVLLLDDIFSELDHEHRQELLKHIGRQQTIITTTDIHLLEKEYREKVEIIKL